MRATIDMPWKSGPKSGLVLGSLFFVRLNVQIDFPGFVVTARMATQERKTPGDWVRRRRENANSAVETSN